MDRFIVFRKVAILRWLQILLGVDDTAPLGLCLFSKCDFGNGVIAKVFIYAP